jgi:hypothetical protein
MFRYTQGGRYSSLQHNNVHLKRPNLRMQDVWERRCKVLPSCNLENGLTAGWEYHGRRGLMHLL